MASYLSEVDANFSGFFDSAKDNINNVLDGHDSQKDIFKESYRRLVGFQAWRKDILENHWPEGARGFFKEGQNDALSSHLLARQGAWRVALMALRSCVENVLFSLYYCDHRIEFALWVQDRHKLGFTEVTNYLSRHPKFIGTKDNDNGIAGIKKEYAELSKAVHGSAESFRMTKSGRISGLNFISSVDLGAWAKRESSAICHLNEILLFFFSDILTGASYRNLRKAVSLAIPESKHAKIKSNFGINLFSKNKL